MKYYEAEELEATDEWFLGVNAAGISDELLFVPSELTKLGVPPVDVVDRIGWLKQHVDRGADGSVHGTIEAEPAAPELVPTVDLLEERPSVHTTESGSLTLDYDGYGAWEWAEPIEKMVEDAIFAVLDSEVELPEFNVLAASCKLRPRSRGKRARAARAAKIQNESSNDSASRSTA